MQEVKLHSRVKFPEGKQKEFLELAMSSLSMSSSELAKIAGVCNRTVRDWKREKNNISFWPLFSICYKQKTTFPKNIEVRPPYWSVKKASKLGGMRRAELYGNPGTPEGRRKGGIRSQEKLRSDPSYAEKSKFKLRKKIKYPHKSALLAEFVGIMLGDGCICSDHQATISFDGEKDGKYAVYLQKLVQTLFGISSAMRIDRKRNSANVVISSTALIEFLHKIGMQSGSKVLNQVDVPKWIFNRKKYQIGCLRGLFDTDGCVYLHKYIVGSKEYSYVKMSFRNYSIPLLNSIKKMLEYLSFQPVIDIKHQTVYINRSAEVKKYFLKISTNNPRYRKRFISFLKK